MSKRTSSDAALADTSPNERAPTAAAATPTTMRRASEIDALLAWNGAAELAAVPPLPLETLRRVQRKLAFVKLLVDDAARRAAAPSATLAALQLVVRDDVRAHERCKVFQLTFEPSTSDLRVCEEPRDPHANAARAAAAKRTQAYALRIAAESEPLPPNLMPSRYTKKTKGSDDSATKAAAASSSTAAATPSSSVASTAAAAAAAGAAGGGGAAVPSPSVHASNFVEMERVCDVAFDFGAARIALRAVLYHRRELTCETIHYRIWFGSHTEPRKSATANSAIDSLFALLQRPVDMRNQADDRERPVFEWFAVRTFETDGVHQLQYVPETFVRRHDALAVTRRQTTQFDPPNYAAQCVDHVPAMLANVEALVRRTQDEGLIGVLESQGAAAMGRELVLRMLQMVPQLRVWNVVEQDVDACFGLAPTQQTVTHNARIKQAGVDYNA